LYNFYNDKFLSLDFGNSMVIYSRIIQDIVNIVEKDLTIIN
jgi:hypothetical protein